VTSISKRQNQIADNFNRAIELLNENHPIEFLSYNDQELNQFEQMDKDEINKINNKNKGFKGKKLTDTKPTRSQTCNQLKHKSDLEY